MSGAPRRVAGDGAGQPVPRSSSKLSDIQVLRGIAITLVLTCHLSFSATILGALDPKLADPFYVGVELFFVISGFVVTRSLLRGSVDPGQFLIRRAFRLFPPLVAALALSAAVIVIFRVVAPGKWALGFFTVSDLEFLRQSAAILSGTFINYIHAIHAPAYVNAAMWSLSVEFQFYAVVAGVLAIGTVFKADKRHVKAVLFALAVFVLCCSVADRMLLDFGHGISSWHYVVESKFDFMAAGVILAFLDERGYLRRFLRLRPRSVIGLLCIPPVVLAFCRSPLTAPVGAADHLSGAGFLIAQACYALVVASAVVDTMAPGAGARLYRLFFLIGERSYTIYVMQFACMALAWLLIVEIKLAVAEARWAFAVVQPIVTFLLLVPITEIIYRGVEMPLNRLGHRLAERYAGRNELAAARAVGRQ